MANTKIITIIPFTTNFDLEYEDGVVVNISYYEFIEDLSNNELFYNELIIAQAKFINDHPELTPYQWNITVPIIDSDHEVFHNFQALNNRENPRLNKEDLNSFLNSGLRISVIDTPENYYKFTIEFTRNNQTFRLQHIADQLNKTYSVFDKYHPGTYHYQGIFTTTDGISLVTHEDTLTVLYPDGTEKEHSITDNLIHLLPLVDRIEIDGQMVDFMTEVVAWYYAYRSFKLDSRNKWVEEHFKNSLRQIRFMTSIGVMNIQTKFFHCLSSGLFFINLGIFDERETIMFKVPVNEQIVTVKAISFSKEFDFFHSVFFPDFTRKSRQVRITEPKECSSCFDEKTEYLENDICPVNGCSMANYCFSCFKNFGFRCMICKSHFYKLTKKLILMEIIVKPN